MCALKMCATKQFGSQLCLCHSVVHCANLLESLTAFFLAEGNRKGVTRVKTV